MVIGPIEMHQPDEVLEVDEDENIPQYIPEDQEPPEEAVVVSFISSSMIFIL